jgi:hypothetical protein
MTHRRRRRARRRLGGLHACCQEGLRGGEQVRRPRPPPPRPRGRRRLGLQPLSAINTRRLVSPQRRLRPPLRRLRVRLALLLLHHHHLRLLLLLLLLHHHHLLQLLLQLLHSRLGGPTVTAVNLLRHGGGVR